MVCIICRGSTIDPDTGRTCTICNGSGETSDFSEKFPESCHVVVTYD